MRRDGRQAGAAKRRGTLMPAIAMSILVAGLCAALVFDRLWLDMARVELRTAAEAAALAAAGRLADDHLLQQPFASTRILDEAREVAVQIAATNRVAGAPVWLDSAWDGDVRFGKVTDHPQTGGAVFLETDLEPTTVVVTARASRSRRNGVDLFFRRLTGVAAGDVIGRAGVSIDSRVTAVRPWEGVHVPALPLGILEMESERNSPATWQQQIDQRQGLDRYGYSEASRQVTTTADGIPEITLTAAVSTGSDSGGATRLDNCCLLDLGNGLDEWAVRRQIASGWSHEDLAGFGGEIPLTGSTTPVLGTAMIAAVLGDLEQVVGRPRICCLYRAGGTDGSGTTSGASIAEGVIVTRLVACRILTIEADSGSGVARMVVQPCVITTPTAVLASADETVIPNPYIFKLHLTH